MKHHQQILLEKWLRNIGNITCDICHKGVSLSSIIDIGTINMCKECYRDYQIDKIL